MVASRYASFNYTTLANRSGYFGASGVALKSPVKMREYCLLLYRKLHPPAFDMHVFWHYQPKACEFQKIKFFLSLAILEFSPYTETFEICFIHPLEGISGVSENQKRPASSNV